MVSEEQFLLKCRTVLEALHSGVLQTQKLKTRLLRTQGSKVLSSKPAVGPCVAMHAMRTAKDFFLANFYPCCPFTCCFFPLLNLSQAFPVLAVANTGSCVEPQNRLGHRTHRYRQLMQVPVSSACGI